MTNITDINRPLLSKKIDNFYVSFYNLPNNISNILGRQVKSISRPALTINPQTITIKGIKQHKISTLDYSEISISFDDDDKSLVTKALYNQIYRQLGKDVEGFEQSKFNIGVKAFDSENNVLEEFELKTCFITNITHSESIYSSSENNVITITVKYNTVDYKFIE